jgi:uncharacterized OB-fold protein
MTAPLLPTTDMRGAARRDARTGPWFDALTTGELLLLRCARCDHFARPDAQSCPACRSDELGWEPARGTGRVVCRIVDHGPTRHDSRPLTLGLVALDEGPWLHARLLGDPCDDDVVTLVVLTPDDGEGEPVPAFRR